MTAVAYLMLPVSLSALGCALLCLLPRRTSSTEADVDTFKRRMQALETGTRQYGLGARRDDDPLGRETCRRCGQ